MKMKMFDGKELPQELLFTTRKKKYVKTIWKQYVNWYKAA